MIEGSTGDLRLERERERERKGGRKSRQALRLRREKKKDICHILKTAALKPSAIDVFWLRKHSLQVIFAA